MRHPDSSPFPPRRRGPAKSFLSISIVGSGSTCCHHESLYYRDHAAWPKDRSALFTRWKNGYWFAHRACHSTARAFYGDVYDIPAALGRFDVVIVGAILEHLSDQIRALASISRVAEKTIVINTGVLKTDEPIAHFMGDSAKPQIDYVFWLYSVGVYRHVLRMLGFEIVRTEDASFLFNDLNQWAGRTAIVAERT